jgi:hypothetical protein
MLGNVSISPKQERLIEALLSGKTIVDAADACGIAEQTAHRWLKDATFQQAYNDARQRLLNHSITALQLKFDQAIATLDRHTNAPKTIPRDQIRAAEVIVSTTLQTAHLMERIAELEAQVAEQQQDRMYKVTFDLRQLSKEERATLEAINARIEAKE